MLNAQDLLLLLGFATTLVEQIPTAKLSQQERYVARNGQIDSSMKAVRPLSETASDLALVVGMILQQQQWDVLLVQKALNCYRSWFHYAVHVEEIKVETLFPYFS